MSARLDGRIAVVTGGAQGIGRAIVDRLHADGATVVVGDLQSPAELRLGQEAIALDVSDPSSVDAFTTEVAERHGGIDILVNNAGVMYEEHIGRSRSRSVGPNDGDQRDRSIPHGARLRPAHEGTARCGDRCFEPEHVVRWQRVRGGSRPRGPRAGDRSATPFDDPVSARAPSASAGDSHEPTV